jgi:RecB family endonuclease NucS
MAIYQITESGFNHLSETSFNVEKIYERKDLQRLLKSNIEALSFDLKVVVEEFDDWADSNRRIDLLCIDKEANLVVVEIKRTDDGGHMELQAIRYAAMVSTMTFRQLVKAHAKFLRSAEAADDEAEKSHSRIPRMG